MKGNCVGNGNRFLFYVMIISAVASHLLILHCIVIGMGGYDNDYHHPDVVEEGSK